MSAEIKRAGQQAAAGDYRAAIDTLWPIWERAADDADEAQGLLEVATAIQAGRARRGVRRDAESLVGHAHECLAYIAATRGVPVGSGTRGERTGEQAGLSPRDLARRRVGLPPAPPLRPDEIRGTSNVSIPAQPNPLTVAAGLAGGVALAVSVFLPLADNTSSFARIVQNTLIQHGGWPVLALGLCAAAAGLRATTGKSMRGTLLILGLIAAGYVVYMASDKSLRTLYPLVNGTPVTSQPGVVAAVGIGIYVAGVGAGIVILGSIFSPGRITASNIVTPPSLARPAAVAQAGPVLAASESTKRCPDCAETVLRDARVCKHCGFRFAPPAG